MRKWHLRDLNVIASPAQDIREVFDLMPTDDRRRLVASSRRACGAVPARSTATSRPCARASRRASCPRAARCARSPRRSRRYASRRRLLRARSPGRRAPATASCRHRSPATSPTARTRRRVAYDELAAVPRRRARSRRPASRTPSAASSTRCSRAASSAPTIDLDETYEWGIEELARMVAEQESIANEIKPGASVDEADRLPRAGPEPQAPRHRRAAALDAGDERPRRRRARRDALRHPRPRSARLECMIAPTQEGGIYYTGPSDDFSRPGRMWWSVPEGVDRVRHLARAHDRVPRGRSRSPPADRPGRRTTARSSTPGGGSSPARPGHAEGWALYAERLMEQLGYLDDPADRLGMLDGQRMRAARVVLDIGVHLGKQRPDGKGTWDGRVRARVPARRTST